MINFEEELKKFKPSLEVNQAEDAIYRNDLKDITDIVTELVQVANQQTVKNTERN